MKKKNYGDPEGMVFGSSEEYYRDSKDYPLAKIIYYIYENQDWRDRIVLDRERFITAKRWLKKKGYISASENAQYSFPEALSELKRKWGAIHSLPSRIDDRTIKLLKPDTDILSLVIRKINPEAKQTKAYLDKQGKALTSLIKRGDL